MASDGKNKDGNKEKHCLTLLWRIENVGFLEGKRDWWTVTSPDFRSRSFEGIRFSLGLIPRYISGNISEVSLEFGITDGTLNCPIDIEWSFIGRNESVLASGIARNTLVLPAGYTPLPGCLTHKEVFSTRRLEFLPYDTLTIQVCVWWSEGNLAHNEFISGQTRLEAVEESFLWPIERFSALALEQPITTPITFGEARGSEHLIVMCSLEGASLSDSILNCGLIHLPTLTPLVVTLKSSILDKNKKVVKRKESGPKYFMPGSKFAWLFPGFVSRQFVMDPSNNCLTDDVLNLFCEVSTIRYTDSITKSYYGYLEMDVSKNSSSRFQPSKQSVDRALLQGKDTGASLVKDLLDKCKNRNLPDFELCSDDVSFPVHKSVLSARSPVFNAMFSSGMKETSTGTLDIPDLDAQTLNRMLTFLYTGTLEPDLAWQDAAKLYYAADKYQVESLKVYCSANLCSNVSVSTISDIIVLADMHQDKELKYFVHQFVMRNFGEIIRSKEWKNHMVSDYAFAGNNSKMLQFYKSKNLKHP